MNRACQGSREFPSGDHENSHPVRVVEQVEDGDGDGGVFEDPVCHMVLEPDRSAGTLRYLCSQYHFCSLACVGVFCGRS